MKKCSVKMANGLIRRKPKSNDAETMKLAVSGDIENYKYSGESYRRK
jgi:hypothetical protein